MFTYNSPRLHLNRINGDSETNSNINTKRTISSHKTLKYKAKEVSLSRTITLEFFRASIRRKSARSDSQRSVCDKAWSRAGAAGPGQKGSRTRSSIVGKERRRTTNKKGRDRSNGSSLEAAGILAIEADLARLSYTLLPSCAPPPNNSVLIRIYAAAEDN